MADDARLERGRTLTLTLTLAAGIFLVDRASKWLIVEVMDLRTLGRIDVLDPYLVLLMAWNRGINFGIPLGGPMFLAALSVAISAALVVWTLRRRTMAFVWGAGLVVGGAVGNALDRLLYGAVADFLNMSCCGFQNPFAFNVADIAIFAGALLIAWKA